MLWYMVRTWVGQEEELAREIRRTVPPAMYNECFVIYQERIWRKQQRNILHTEPLFPGCVFVTCLETTPLFRRLERVPAISRLIFCGVLVILPLMQEDADFLEQISDGDHVVHLSHVDKEAGSSVLRITGPLSAFGQIERFQFKKRCAIARHRLWGEEKSFALGLLLREDIDATGGQALSPGMETPERETLYTATPPHSGLAAPLQQKKRERMEDTE